MVSDGREVAEASILPIDVVDTTGDGDSFIAGFIAARVTGNPLRVCLEVARQAAAATCIHIGGFRQVPAALKG
jgi:fructoselysine 6-kinase